MMYGHRASIDYARDNRNQKKEGKYNKAQIDCARAAYCKRSYKGGTVCKNGKCPYYVSPEGTSDWTKLQ